MNPVTANDILSYQGNVGLGLSESGAINSYGDTDMSEANSMIFNAAYLNAQKNKAVWEQKIKERDQGMQLVNDGQLMIQAALPKDRAILENKIKEIKEIYLKNNGDVKSKADVWYDLNNKLADFKEARTLASSRYLTYTGGVAETAKEVNPYKRDKMSQHWNGQLETDIYKPMNPYQQTLDWDNAVVYRPMKTKTTPTGTNGFFRTTETKTDLPESYRDYVNAYQQGDKRIMGLNVDTFLDSFYGNDGILTPELVQEKTQEVNNRLKKIAIDEGFDPENVSSLPNYLKPVQITMQNGKIQSNGYKWDDWYKIMLYDQYKKTSSSEYDKGLESQAKTQAGIAKDKSDAAANTMRARAYAEAQRAAAGKSRMQTKLIEEQTTPAQNFDELKTKAETIKTQKGFVTRVSWDDLQNNTRDYLDVDPFTANNGKTRFINIVPTKIMTKDGQVLNDEMAEDKYNEAVGLGYQGSIIDYLNSVGLKYDIEIVGREKGKKQVERSGRLSSYQNQQKGKNKSSLLLEDDNTPTEIDE